MKNIIFIGTALRFILNCIELVGFNIDPMISNIIDYIGSNIEDCYATLYSIYLQIRGKL